MLVEVITLEVLNKTLFFREHPAFEKYSTVRKSVCSVHIGLLGKRLNRRISPFCCVSVVLRGTNKQYCES